MFFRTGRPTFVLVACFLSFSGCTQSVNSWCDQKLTHFSSFYCPSPYEHGHLEENFFDQSVTLYEALPYYKFCGRRRTADWHDELRSIMQLQTARLLRRIESPEFSKHSPNGVIIPERYLNATLLTNSVRNRAANLDSPYFVLPRIEIVERSNNLILVEKSSYALTIKVSTKLFDILCHSPGLAVVHRAFTTKPKAPRDRLELIFANPHNQQYLIGDQEGLTIPEFVTEDSATYLRSLDLMRLLIVRNFEFEASLEWALGHELYHLKYPLPVTASCEERRLDEARADMFGALLSIHNYGKLHAMHQTINHYRSINGQLNTPEVIRDSFNIFQTRSGVLGPMIFDLFLLYGAENGSKNLLKRIRAHSECYFSNRRRIEIVDQFIDGIYRS